MHATFLIEDILDAISLIFFFPLFRTRRKHPPCILDAKATRNFKELWPFVVHYGKVVEVGHLFLPVALGAFMHAAHSLVERGCHDDLMLVTLFAVIRSPSFSQTLTLIVAGPSPHAAHSRALTKDVNFSCSLPALL